MEYVYELALSEILKDPAVDAAICIAIAPELPENAHLDATGIIKKTAASFPEKPVVSWLYGPNQLSVSNMLEQGGQVVSLPTLPRAARTLAMLRDRGAIPPKGHIEQPAEFPITRAYRIFISNLKPRPPPHSGIFDGRGVFTTVHAIFHPLNVLYFDNDVEHPSCSRHFLPHFETATRTFH